MGTEQFWIPAVISALGAGAGAYNTHKTASAQDRAAAAGIRQQGVRQREADQVVGQQIGAMEGSTPEAARAQALEQFMGQLRANRGSAGVDPLAGGGDRYQTDVAQAKAGVQNFGGQVADTLSRIVAPGRQRENEALSQGRTSTDLSLIGRMASGDDFLNQLRINSIRRNPWIDAGGQVLQGIGSSMAMGQASRAGLSEGTMRRLTQAGGSAPSSPFGGAVPPIRITG